MLYFSIYLHFTMYRALHSMWQIKIGHMNCHLGVSIAVIKYHDQSNLGR